MSCSTLIALLGLPGSGKGTQGGLLHQVLSYQYLATGDLVREIKDSHKKDILTLEVIKRYGRGEPQPDYVINKIVKNKVETLLDKKGLIIDAYPLSMGQVCGLANLVRDFTLYKFTVLYLRVPEEILIKRLSSRKICEKCNTPFAAAGEVTICPCGGSLISRDDDKPAVVRERIKAYQERFKPILGHYLFNGDLMVIDGNQSIAAVHTDILNSLKERGIF